MKIVSTDLQARSARSYDFAEQSNQKLQISSQQRMAKADDTLQDDVSITSAGSRLSAQQSVINSQSVVTQLDDPSSTQVHQHQEIIQSMVAETFGTSVDIKSVQGAFGDDLTQEELDQSAKVTFSIDMVEERTLVESEQLSIETLGTVTTEDGREINFMMSMELQRHYSETSTESMQGTTEWIDPLVLNFAGGVPALKDSTFEFDLNADGETEEISQLASGTGFLVFDKNADGELNDGTELFGALTGQGYEELAQLDEDGNGWIDEGDAAYAQLSLWTQNEDGPGQLQSLEEMGIGALSIDAIMGNFTMTDHSNQGKAEITATGVALAEDGKVLAMQQMNFANQASDDTDDIDDIDDIDDVDDADDNDDDLEDFAVSNAQANGIPTNGTEKFANDDDLDEVIQNILFMQGSGELAAQSVNPDVFAQGVDQTSQTLVAVSDSGELNQDIAFQFGGNSFASTTNVKWETVAVQYSEASQLSSAQGSQQNTSQDTQQTDPAASNGQANSQSNTPSGAYSEPDWMASLENQDPAGDMRVLIEQLKAMRESQQETASMFVSIN